MKDNKQSIFKKPFNEVLAEAMKKPLSEVKEEKFAQPTVAVGDIDEDEVKKYLKEE